MEKRTKFNDMLNKSDESRSSSEDKKLEKRAKKDYEKEQKRLQRLKDARYGGGKKNSEEEKTSAEAEINEAQNNEIAEASSNKNGEATASTNANEESVTQNENDKTEASSSIVDEPILNPVQTPKTPTSTNSHVQKVDLSQLKQAKKELNKERGIVEPESEEISEKNANSAQNDENSAQIQQNNDENAEKTTDSNGSYSDASSKEAAKPKPTFDYQDDGFYVGDNSKIITATDPTKPPEVSQTDNITQEEIDAILRQQEEEQRRIEAEKEAEQYKNMTEEEIAEAKERRKAFEELRQKYNNKDESVDGSAGDYKKNLDFTVNTSIKQFKLTPPKKPFIIAASIVAFMIVVVSLITYLIINRPSKPIALADVEISQPMSEQYVGETIDLDGIYLIRHFSDGSTDRLNVQNNMIDQRKCSQNIDSNLVITSYLADTFVVIEYEGYELRLRIEVSELILNSISVEVYQENLEQGSVLKFDNILVIANVGFLRGNRLLEYTSNIRIKADQTRAFYIGEELEVAADNSGFILPLKSGDIEIEFRFGSTQVSYKVTLHIA